jgi:Tfp pilus assembly protein PilN
MKYEINLIHEMRLGEKRAKRDAALMTWTSFILAGILTLAIFKGLLFTLLVREDLRIAQNKLNQLKAEYQRYQATNISVQKEDVELLDRMQHSRVFWTKKLSAMASPLPSNYWVNSIHFKTSKLGVKGFGYLDQEQKQLVTLDDYLNVLRSDSVFIKGISQVALVETRRSDLDKEENLRERISFEYSALQPIVVVSATPSSTQQAR